MSENLRRNTIENADVFEYVRSLPSESVNCVVTSPPYYGLRDYGTGSKWVGGDANCNHRGKVFTSPPGSEKQASNRGENAVTGLTCEKCGATREDKQLGLENTPQLFIEHLVSLFTEIKRILRKDGTVWLNLGDSYAGSANGRAADESSKMGIRFRDRPIDTVRGGFKPKDLMMIPHRVAIALQDSGWWVRNDIILSKSNPMPESARDRCTLSHEYVFLLTKSERYWIDMESIREIAISYNNPSDGNPSLTRNKRTVWNVQLCASKESHFASFSPDWIRPMVKAGCPDKTCSICGMPYKIVVATAGGMLGASWTDHSQDPFVGKSRNILSSDSFSKYQRSHSYVKNCNCDSAIVPGVVFDPFMGSGTTALVAVQEGRDYIGCDLNPEYVAMSNNRLSKADPFRPYEHPEGIIQHSLFENL